MYLAGPVNDLKTLRLASLQLSKEGLEGFITYQRTLLSELGHAPVSNWSGRYAFAHGRALMASRLDVLDLGKIKAMVGDFCGRRWASRQIKDRLAHAGHEPSPKDAERLSRAAKELLRLEDLSPFAARHGPEAVALLMAYEAELLHLHGELAKAEGTGHLHIEKKAP